MTWTKADVDNCSLGELFWFVERLQEQRKAENEANRKASQRK